MYPTNLENKNFLNCNRYISRLFPFQYLTSQQEISIDNPCELEYLRAITQKYEIKMGKKIPDLYTPPVAGMSGLSATFINKTTFFPASKSRDKKRNVNHPSITHFMFPSLDLNKGADLRIYKFKECEL